MEQLDKHLLRHVFGFMHVFEEQPTEVYHSGLMSVVQLLIVRLFIR
jgi:hypothetical protein